VRLRRELHAAGHDAGPRVPRLRPTSVCAPNRVDETREVGLRYDSRLYKIGLGGAYKGRAVKLLIADREIHVIDSNGELIRELTLDPSRCYQPLGRRSRVQDVPTHVSGMT
jgi:hypothetical protein